MEIHHISRRRYLHTITWAVLACLVIIGAAAGIGRATLNFSAALTEKPDIGIYLLLPEENIRSVELLREQDDQRDYLIQTNEGPKYVQMKMGEKEWYVSDVQTLHE